MRKILLSLTVPCLLFFNFSLAQDTLFTENFESGSSTQFTLNTTDMGGTSTPNFWIINNAYTGGSGSLICLGFPFSYTINSTPTQPASITNNPTSYYLHTMSIYGQADNIYCSSYAAADGICIPTSSNFAKMNAGINTVGYTNVSLKFWWNCAGSPTIYGEVVYSTNGGTTWNTISTPISQYNNQSSWIQQTISLSAFDNQADLRFAYRFVNNTTNTALDPGFSIDDIMVLGTPLQTITPGTINPTSYCAGDTVQVPYTKQGTWTVGNTFTAELSDALGTFASPIFLGSVVDTGAGTITGIIPGATPAGTAYRIRVVSSMPAVTGADNGADLTVIAGPIGGLAAANPASICENDSATVGLTGQSGTIQWEISTDGVNYSPTGLTTPNISTGPLTSDTWYRAIVTNACGSTVSNAVQVIIVPTPIGGIATPVPDSICNGDSATITLSGYGGTVGGWEASNNGTNYVAWFGGSGTTVNTGPLGSDSWFRVGVSNQCGATFSSAAFIYVDQIPVAAFTAVTNGPIVTLTDGSVNAGSWSWDFGDGNTSTLQNPVHTYASDGTFPITLVVTSLLGCETDTLQNSVTVQGDGIFEGGNGQEITVLVFPNPGSGAFNFDFSTTIPTLLELVLTDALGKTIWAENLGKMQRVQRKIGPAVLSHGVYFLHVLADGNRYTEKLIVR